MYFSTSTPFASPPPRETLCTPFCPCKYVPNNPSSFPPPAVHPKTSQEYQSSVPDWLCLKPNSWTYNFIEVSGHNLESSQTWGFRIQCLHYKPVSIHFCWGEKWGKICSRGDLWGGGGGLKSANRGNCEQQKGKLLRRLSQLCPRIPPQPC